MHFRTWVHFKIAPPKMHLRTLVHFKIATSKNAFQNIGALQNSPLKNCISEHGYTSKLLPQKMHILTDEHKQEGFKKILIDDHSFLW